MIKEKGKATIEGGEGELLLYQEPGTEVTFIDGISEGKKVSIESPKTRWRSSPGGRFCAGTS